MNKPYGDKLQCVLRDDPYSDGHVLSVSHEKLGVLAEVFVSSGPVGVGIRVQDRRSRFNGEGFSVFPNRSCHEAEIVLDDGSVWAEAHNKWYVGKGKHPGER